MQRGDNKHKQPHPNAQVPQYRYPNNGTEGGGVTGGYNLSRIPTGPSQGSQDPQNKQQPQQPLPPGSMPMGYPQNPRGQQGSYYHPRPSTRQISNNPPRMTANVQHINTQIPGATVYTTIPSQMFPGQTSLGQVTGPVVIPMYHPQMTTRHAPSSGQGTGNQPSLYYPPPQQFMTPQSMGHPQYNYPAVYMTQTPTMRQQYPAQNSTPNQVPPQQPTPQQPTVGPTMFVDQSGGPQVTMPTIGGGPGGPNGTLMGPPGQPAISIVPGPMTSGLLQSQQAASKKEKPRRYALQIIDPLTGNDVLAGVRKEEDGSSHSADSSGSHTPQPKAGKEDDIKAKQVVGEFASKVAAAAFVPSAPSGSVVSASAPPHEEDRLNGPVDHSHESERENAPSPSLPPPAAQAPPPQPQPAPLPPPSTFVPTVSAITDSPPVELHRPSPPSVSAVVKQLPPGSGPPHHPGHPQAHPHPHSHPVHAQAHQLPAQAHSHAPAPAPAHAHPPAPSPVATPVPSSSPQPQVSAQAPQPAPAASQTVPPATVRKPQGPPSENAILTSKKGERKKEQPSGPPAAPTGRRPTAGSTPPPAAATTVTGPPPAATATVVGPPPAPAVPKPTNFSESISFKSFVPSSNPSPAVSAPAPAPAPAPAVSEDKSANGDADPPTGKAIQRPKKKQKDLNRKGVEKAGTEMDAFVEPPTTPAARDPTPPARDPTPTPPPASEPKARPIENSTAPVIEFMQNDEVEPEESSSIAGDEGTDIDAMVAAKNEENAKVSAALAAANNNNNNITSVPAGKDDVEDPVEADADENDDEPQNIKSMTIERSTAAAAPSLKYNYKDGQWSPLNVEGKKVYDRDFLLEIKNSVLALKKPEFNLELDIFRDKPSESSLPNTRRNVHGSSSMSSRGDNVGAYFTKSSNSSNQRMMSKMSSRDRGPPRGGMGLSNSQSGMRGMGKGGYTSVNNYMSSREPEPILHKDPNGWKPARLQGSAPDLTEEQRKIEKLQKQIRGILNKLTPQKFEKLLAQILDLPIETEAHLKEMVNLVFEKAVDEPSFSKAYADLCQRLQKKVIQTRLDTNGASEGQAVVGVTFRKLLLNKCQEGFEKNKADELDIAKRQKEIDETTDVEKKKELKLLLEEDERKIRRKSVGLVRFIGELYKLHMLTPKIMHGCITTLLSQIAEEPLECLCKLLTTIGKELEKESNKKEFDDYFAQMGKLAQKTPDSKVSSRIRFMLQDVIELRQKGWKPRRDENNPKTIEQIHKEAERDAALESVMLSSAPAPNPRRHPGDRRNNRSNQDNDGWQTSGGKYRSSTYTNTIEASKLQHLKSDADAVSLGGTGTFSQWTSGSSTKRSGGMDSSKNLAPNSFTNNKFAILAPEDRMSKPPFSSGGSSLSGKGKMSGSTSMDKERGMGMMRDRDDRDRRPMGSGPPSREASRQRYGQSGHSPAGSLNSRPDRDFRPDPSSRYSNQPDNREPTESRVPAANAPAPDLDEDEAQRKAETIFDEWVANNDVEETLSTVNETFLGQKNQCLLVRLLLNKVIEGKPAARIKFAELLVVILQEKKVLTSKDVINEFRSLIEIGDDMVVDIPFFWTFVGQIFSPLIENEVVSFDEMKQALDERPHKDRAKVLSEVFKTLSQNNKTNVWKESNAKLTDFVPEDEIENFTKSNNFWFLSSDSDEPPSDIRKHREHLVQILSTESDKAFDEACSFLSKIEDSVPKKAFIEIVTMAVIKASLKDGKLNQRQLVKLIKLIHKYVDNNEELELICLFAIKNLIVNELTLELTNLTESFRILYEDSIISVEAFKKWREDTTIEPLESKGRILATRALEAFYVFLAEADEDDEDS